MNSKKIKYLLGCVFTFLIFFSQGQTSIKHVDAASFKKLIEIPNNVLIDLRTKNEIQTKGSIPGAIHIDFLGTDFEEQLKKLDKDKTYLVYCAGGGRSSDCAALMQKKEFKEVINLEKGFDDWKKSGFETEKKQD